MYSRTVSYRLRPATGPMKVAGSRGSPTTTESAARAATSTARSYTASATSIRVGALHVWPELCMHPSTPFATALSTSTSSNTMLADLPPSSCETRLIEAAAVRATWAPTCVDPVIDTMSTSG